MRSTKVRSTFITSVLSLLLCVAMLIGTTFAWFTDTASTGINKIQTGNLDIEFEYWNVDKSAYEVIGADTYLFDESSRWEPGHTETAYVRVKNAGNLALQYQLSVFDYWSNSYKNVNGDNVKLEQFVKIAVIDDVDAATGVYNREEAIAAVKANDTGTIMENFSVDGVLLPEDNDKYFAIVAYMPESVGNEANPMTSSNPYIRCALQITATQTSHENDSFGNTYDEGLAHPNVGIDTTGMTETEIAQIHAKVCTAANKALNKGSVMLGQDISSHTGLQLTNDIDATLDMNGKTFETTERSQQACVTAMYGLLTIKGDGVFDASKNERTTSINNGGQAVNVYSNGGVIIEGGTFIGRDGRSCIYTTGGSVTIKGGFFMIKDATSQPYVVNMLDGCGAEIQIMGGTFVNFNPEDTNTEPDEGGVAKDNFLAPGYKVVSEIQENGDVWYTVVPE